MAQVPRSRANDFRAVNRGNEGLVRCEPLFFSNGPSPIEHAGVYDYDRVACIDDEAVVTHAVISDSG